jgi:hypothetical protein
MEIDWTALVVSSEGMAHVTVKTTVGRIAVQRGIRAQSLRRIATLVMEMEFLALCRTPLDQSAGPLKPFLFVEAQFPTRRILRSEHQVSLLSIKHGPATATLPQVGNSILAGTVYLFPQQHRRRIVYRQPNSPYKFTYIHLI